MSLHYLIEQGIFFIIFNYFFFRFLESIEDITNISYLKQALKDFGEISQKQPSIVYYNL